MFVANLRSLALLITIHFRPIFLNFLLYLVIGEWHFVSHTINLSNIKTLIISNFVYIEIHLEKDFFCRYLEKEWNHRPAKNATLRILR
jgi:hypothetical protein